MRFSLLPSLLFSSSFFSFSFFSKEVHDVCHNLGASYDKLIQVLLVRTIQLGNTAKNKMMAAPSTTSINSNCPPETSALSPNAGLALI